MRPSASALSSERRISVLGSRDRSPFFTSRWTIEIACARSRLLIPPRVRTVSRMRSRSFTCLYVSFTGRSWCGWMESSIPWGRCSSPWFTADDDPNARFGRKFRVKSAPRTGHAGRVAVPAAPAPGGAAPTGVRARPAAGLAPRRGRTGADTFAPASVTWSWASALLERAAGAGLVPPLGQPQPLAGAASASPVATSLARAELTAKRACSRSSRTWSRSEASCARASPAPPRPRGPASGSSRPGRGSS